MSIGLRFFLDFTVLLRFNDNAEAEIHNKIGDSKINHELSFTNYFHNDSIHQLNFRYPDKKRGFNVNLIIPILFNKL